MIGLLLAMLAAQAVIATLDVLYVRLRHVRSLRMSRQELMDEHKDAEGNPQIKRRIKQIRFNRARRRMLKAVPTATVVVTNPTHFAVALAYDRAKGGAPRVVAEVAGISLNPRPAELKDFDYKTFKKQIYPGANHAFNNDTGPSWNEQASYDAWTRTLDWFKRYLV